MKFSRYQWFGVGLVLGLALVIYGLTAAVGLTGMADSDELLGVVWQLGVAHPPGYPLFELVSYGLMRFLSFAIAPVRAGQLAQVVWQSMAMAMWFGAGYGWLRQVMSEIADWKMWWVSLVGAGWVLVSLWLWQYGLFLEVFGFQLLLMMGWLGWMVWVEELGGMIDWWLWVVGGLGLSFLLGHHQLSVLLLPGFGWLLWRWWKERLVRQRDLLMMGGGLVFGLIGQTGLLGWLGQRGSSLSWKFEPNFAGIWRMATRADFSGFLFGHGEVGAYVSQISLQAMVVGFVDYWGRILPTNFGWFGVSFILIGLYVLWQKREQRLASLAGLWWLFTGPLLSLYLTAPSLLTGEAAVEQAALAERMWLMNLMLSGLLLLLGLVQVYRWLVRVVGNRRWLFAGWVGFLVLFVVVLGRQHFNKVRMDNYTLADVWVQRVLSGAPEQAVILCFSDVSCFGLRSGAVFYGERPDITIVPVTEQLSSIDGVGELVEERYMYPDNPFRMGAVLTASVQEERPVALFQPDAFYREWLGLQHGVWVQQPVPGGVGIGCDGTDFTNAFGEVVDVSQVRERGGSAFFKRHAMLFGETVDMEDGDHSRCQPAAYWWQQAAQCPEADFACQYQRVYWAMLMAPYEAESHVRLASVLEQAGHAELALREYRIGLALDAESAVAQEGEARLVGVEELEFRLP